MGAPEGFPSFSGRDSKESGRKSKENGRKSKGFSSKNSTFTLTYAILSIALSPPPPK
jgi:hypothetical protein